MKFIFYGASNRVDRIRQFGDSNVVFLIHKKSNYHPTQITETDYYYNLDQDRILKEADHVNISSLKNIFARKGKVLKQPVVINLLNSSGLLCSGPLIEIARKLKPLLIGDVLLVNTVNYSYIDEIKAWCKITGHSLLSSKIHKGSISAVIQK